MGAKGPTPTHTNENIQIPVEGNCCLLSLTQSCAGVVVSVPPTSTVVPTQINDSHLSRGVMQEGGYSNGNVSVKRYNSVDNRSSWDWVHSQKKKGGVSSSCKKQKKKEKEK